MKLEGVYLVIDPSQEKNTLLNKLLEALKGGIRIVQVWNHWGEEDALPEKITFLHKVKVLCRPFDVPVLMHDDWQLALKEGLHGVHFDEVPSDFDVVKTAMQDCIIGVTVGNEVEKIAWAEAQGISYMSFCAVFPSSSVDTCEIVDQKSIQLARTITQIPIFLSGGIQTDNLSSLAHLAFDGVAVISGILSADDPKRAVEGYINELEKIKKKASCRENC